VAKHHDQPQAVPQVVDGIAQTAEHIVAEAVAGDTNDEQVIRAFVEDEFDRHARIRATQHRRKGALFRWPPIFAQHAKVSRVHLDDTMSGATV
jgi:hypothetical protein